MGNNKKFKVANKKTYNDFPKVEYKKQEETKKFRRKRLRVIDFEKIIEAYKKCLDEWETYSNKNDYAIKMVCGYLRLKTFQSYLKKCFNKYKADKFNPVNILEVAKLLGVRKNCNWTCYNFFQTIMRINLPLNEIQKEIKSDEDLIKKVLNDETIESKFKIQLLGAQNEFFAKSGKRKPTGLDKEFFANFENMFDLSIAIPVCYGNKNSEPDCQDLIDDLNEMTWQEFVIAHDGKLIRSDGNIYSSTGKVVSKHKNSSKEKQNNSAVEEKQFLKGFIGKIEGFEDDIDNLLIKYNIGTKTLIEEDKEFDLDRPILRYRKLETYAQCKKFLTNTGKSGKFTRMQEYFDYTKTYINEFDKVSTVSDDYFSKVWKSFSQIIERYEFYSRETVATLDKLLGPESKPTTGPRPKSYNDTLEKYIRQRIKHTTPKGKSAKSKGNSVRMPRKKLRIKN